jgi:signal transduction histidine kinase
MAFPVHQVFSLSFITMHTRILSFLNKRLFWGIRLWELLAFVGFHACLGLMYSATLWLTVSQPQTLGIAINHTLKILLTAPLWWLFFRRLRHWPFNKKVMLHVPSSILYVAVWLGIFYLVVDFFGVGRLRGAGIWWDVYIPILIYLMQFGIFHAYNYWAETIRQQEKEKALLRMTYTAELNTLKAQIQPHFLFNTLNSISASVPASQENTRSMIACLADVFRFAMNVSDKEFIPLEKELLFIQNFLSLEQQRFGDRLQVFYTVDDQLEEYPIPPMLLQPLVENAVKHGIAKSVEGGRIHIAIKKVEDKVRFTISDTGKGINGTPHDQLFKKGIGLENTRQRLLRLYGEELHLKPLSPKGVSVVFSLPLHHKNGPLWN